MTASNMNNGYLCSTKLLLFKKANLVLFTCNDRNRLPFTQNLEKMNKPTVWTVILLFLGITLQAQQGLPPNPEPGKCYVRCVTDDKFETVEEKIMIRPEYKTLKVVPAEYKTVEETVEVKPASVKYVYVPATYKTETITMQVEEPYNKITTTEANLSPDTKTVVIQEAYSHWEWKSASADCKSDDPRDCQILCYVKYPEITTGIGIRNLDQDAAYTKAPAGGKDATYKKQVEVTPARYETIEIPAEYKTITKQVLVKDETVVETVVPAEYRTYEVTRLVEEGGLEQWVEIDCKLTDLNVLPIYYELGSARLTAEARKVIDDKLFALLTAKPGIRIELNSHTDSRGSASSNQDLSQRRAQSVVNYLASKGISRNRLVARGFGETQLKNGCSDGVECSEEMHAVNRRTEFRVLPN